MTRQNLITGRAEKLVTFFLIFSDILPLTFPACLIYDGGAQYQACAMNLPPGILTPAVWVAQVNRIEGAHFEVERRGDGGETQTAERQKAGSHG